MTKIIYGKNSLHCKVAAALLLGQNATSKSFFDKTLINKPQEASVFTYVGADKKTDIYYIAAKKDYQIIPEIIKSLEEMYGLKECELIKVTGSTFYYDILASILRNYSNNKFFYRLYNYMLKRIVSSLNVRQATN